MVWPLEDLFVSETSTVRFWTEYGEVRSRESQHPPSSKQEWGQIGDSPQLKKGACPLFHLFQTFSDKKVPLFVTQGVDRIGKGGFDGLEADGDERD